MTGRARVRSRRRVTSRGATKTGGEARVEKEVTGEVRVEKEVTGLRGGVITEAMRDLLR